MAIDIVAAIAGEMGLDGAAINVTLPATQEIVISAANDSIKIGDGSGNFASVSASGAIKMDGSLVTQPVSAASLPLPAGAATAANQASLNVSAASLDSKTVIIDTSNVTVTASALPTGAATAALQTQPGVDIGDVTINNASGAGAVNIQDGGNSITVDGTVTANAGTNLNTSLLALESGGNLATAVASLNVMDDWDESDRAKVNLIVGQAGVQGGAGAVTPATQRVAIVTDQTFIPASAAPGTLTDRSGIATGTSATLMAANSNRKYILIQSTGSNGIWINFTSTAAAASPSILLSGQNSTFLMEGSFVSTEAIMVIRNGNSNQTFTAKEG